LSLSQIDRFVFAKVIEGVILKSGDEILFDGQCGLYDDEKHFIAGVTEAGEDTSFSLNRIESVPLGKNNIDSSQREKVNLRKFVSEASKQPWRVHHGRSVRPGKSIDLRRSNGSFDPGMKSFTGVTRQGKPIAVSSDEVQLQTRKFSASNTTLLSIGISTAIGPQFLSM
jgi:hypothetical protein